MFASTIVKNYTIVKTREQFDAARKHVLSHDFLAFDTETTGLNVRKEKVIGFSFCGKEGEAFYIPHLVYDTDTKTLNEVWSRAKCLELLNLLLKKRLLTWNGSFDARVVKNYFYLNLTDNIEADGMLLQHTLCEDGPFALKDCAIQYQQFLGLDVERAANEEQIALKANVLQNGGTVTKGNFEMYKADLELLGTYAAADADLTFRLCEYLNSRLCEEGLDSLFYETEVMPLYRTVTIPMEDNGVCIDVALLDKSYAEIKIAIEEHHKEVIDALQKEPAFEEWYLNRIAEEYPPSPRGKFAAGVNEVFNLGLVKVLKKSVEALPESDYKHFLLTGNFSDTKLGDYLTGFERGLSKVDAEKVQRYLYEKDNKWPINLNSKSQLSSLVFDYIGVKSTSQTKGGAPQFNDDFIESIEDRYKWAKVLSDYNKLVKIRSSYFERLYEMLEDGKVYFGFKQHGTISGRYSSDAQQFPRPKEEGELSPTVLKFNNVIRAILISGPGRVFIDDDYESLEPHVFSHVSGDKKIQEIFHKGWDFYSTIAIRTEGIEGVSADKKAENYLGKLNKPKRQSAKAYSLGVPYGMTGYALAKALGISTEEGERLVEAYLTAFPDLANWMAQSRDFVKAFGYIKTQAGRVRHLPRVKELYALHGDKLLDFRYRKSLEKRLGSEVVLNMYRDYKNGLNNALNFQIQGLSASIINLAMIEMTKQFKEHGLNAYVALTVHDQCIVDSSEACSDKVSRIVQTTMENSVKLDVALKAKPQFAYNMRDGH
jgi:DNA polymerase I-like protein with 3'-5' exonuclease and polymerase domains